MDTPVSQLQQRQRVTNNVTGVKERDLSVRTQAQLLQHINPKVTQAQQSYPDSSLDQLPSEWERSQEFEINVGDQSVRVSFKAFYFSRNVFGCGIHHARVLWTQYKSDRIPLGLLTGILYRFLVKSYSVCPAEGARASC